MSDLKSEEGHSETSPYACEPMKRIVQNFVLIWLDDQPDESTTHFHHSVSLMQTVVNDVHRFQQLDEAIDFLTEIEGTRGFLIVNRSISEQILPLIHDIPQLDNIYILNTHQCQPKEWPQQWVKIRGIYTNISVICEALPLAVKQCEQDSISMSFLSAQKQHSNINLNQLEPSFIHNYSKKLSSIWTTMNNPSEH